jgi:hypothetical protein
MYTIMYNKNVPNNFFDVVLPTYDVSLVSDFTLLSKSMAQMYVKTSLEFSV